jgi:uncharacterized protein (DUF58 family)
VRTSVRPTGRGVGAFLLGDAALALGLVAGYPGLVGLGVALLAVVLVSLAGVLVPAPVEVRRHLEPARVRRLSRCAVVLDLTNRGRVPVTVTVRDRVGDEHVGLDVPRLLPGQPTRSALAMPVQRRGVVATGPVRLHRSGLADLFRVTAVHGSAAQVTVLPRVLPCRGLPAGVRRGQVGADERVLQGGTDLVGLREYVPGDDLRRLHAATSARTGVLMVREDADPGRPHLTLLLDDRTGSYATADDFEEACDATVSLVRAARAEGHPVRVVTSSGGIEVGADPGAAAGAGRGDDLADRVGQLLAELGDPAGSGPLAGRAALGRHDPDVLVLVSGSRATASEQHQVVAGAQLGVAVVVDPRPERTVSAAGAAVVLRGPRAEDLLHAWDRAVAG